MAIAALPLDNLAGDNLPRRDDEARARLHEVARGVALGDARRLEARARERESVLVVAETHGAVWPGGAVFTLHAAASAWEEHAASVVDARRLRVEVEGRGAAARPRAGELARAG